MFLWLYIFILRLLVAFALFSVGGCICFAKKASVLWTSKFAKKIAIWEKKIIKKIKKRRRRILTKYYIGMHKVNCNFYNNSTTYMYLSIVFGLLNFRVSEIYGTGIEICQKNLQAFSNICIVRGKVSRCFRSFLFEKNICKNTISNRDICQKNWLVL